MQAFKHYVEEKSANQCNIWKDTPEGVPEILCKAVGTCVQKELLKQLKPSYKHFGSQTKMTAAYMEKVLNWPTVTVENVSSLQDYALLFAWMQQCNV